MQSSKIMTMQEAVSKFVHPGLTLMIAGFFHSIPYAITHEIIRQGIKGLTICQSAFNEHADQLIGAGCVRRIVSSYVWMEIFGGLSCFRRAVEKQIPNPVEMEDYTNFSMTCRFMAGALGIPYIPLFSMIGSDMVTHSSWMGSEKVKLLKDPFGSGVEHVLVPALNPDLGIIHAQRADEQGNVQMWGILGDTPWSLRACRNVVASVEEIVSRETIGKDPNRTVLPAYKVVAVVEAPFGAHPKNCQGFYNVDREFIFNYLSQSKRLEDWCAWMQDWVYGVADRAAYVAKLIALYGEAKFSALRAGECYSPSINNGY
jgi:glutaconate CoA-transferase subunit A